MPNATDLWPADLGVGATIEPVELISEQASLLSEKTQGLVKAELIPIKGSKEGMLAFGFYFVAPVLDNYRIRVFTVAFDVVHVYPLRFVTNFLKGKSDSEYVQEIESLEALREVLARLFSSESVKNAILALKGQSLSLPR